MTTYTAFPLRLVTRAEFRSLCETLWDWSPDACRHGGACTLSTLNPRPPPCHRGSLEQLELVFFDFYRETTSSYVTDFFGDEHQALRSHQDLFDIISTLKSNHQKLIRKECQAMYFAARSSDDRETTIPIADQERAFNLAATVMTMVKTLGSEDGNNMSATAGYYEEQEHGQRVNRAPFIWNPDQTLQTALLETFPTRLHPSLQDGNADADTILSNLTAVNLARIAKLKFEHTNDLRDHLRLNPVSGIVQIFSLTSVLKEHLLASKRMILDSDEHDDFYFPRFLALETLYTFRLLFPQDEKSQALLRNLVAKHDFDPDCLRFGTAPFELQSTDERQRAAQFPVWGSRLMDLYDEIENPKPRGMLDAWLERRSKSRHVMMATIVGVSVAIVLGILSLGVSCFQAWISWQEWKGQSPPGPVAP
ncbi:hypothetical protein B0H66DRAFT_478959 [Apodospora peruviana]|uniref:Uncharacterized protein n=1 Tax=Apodospora peruviana TaxID=516989 RepID=A0AAE0M251_9PEZI|nr:hypothetical protein B0H66DRAFT_478959 [Apodospora peruviana]